MKLAVSMFARMQDNDCLYFEQPAEHEHRIAIAEPCPGLSFEPSADVLSSAYSLSGGESIELRCEISLSGSVFCAVSASCLDEIAVDETKPKTREKNRLYLYYAEPGESVWAIAKRYNASPAAIWEENALAADVLPDRTMLMIPIV
jgi:LysM repeat protein